MLDDAIGYHACSLEASIMRVTNAIPRKFTLLPVDTVNCVATLKVLDFITGEWSAFPVTMPAQMCNHAAVVHEDTLYVVGGREKVCERVLLTSATSIRGARGEFGSRAHTCVIPTLVAKHTAKIGASPYP
jgi:hypothetical protein